MSLIARHLEANGVPTMCLASAYDIIEAGHPPRATFVDYPLGHTAGKPFDKEDQYAVVRAALLGLEAATREGGITSLPNRWSDNEDWKDKAADSSGGDTRQPRDETPRFQTDEDRAAAIASGALVA